MTKEEFIKKIMKKAPPFVNKEGLPSWLEYAYQEGYKEAVEKAVEWLHLYLGDKGDYLNGESIEKFKKDMKGE